MYYCLEEVLKHNSIDDCWVIANNKVSLIAEIKKASPSAGIIIKDYNPIDIAKKYNENKATCLY